MKATGKIILGLGLIGALAGGAWWYSNQQAAQNPEQRYKLATLEKGEVTQTVSANGTLNPVVLVSVGTQVSGTVRKLYVDFNDKVEAGQPLLELDAALLTALVKQSDANVSSASAALELAQANEARMRSLFAQEYVSRQEYETTRQVLKSATAQLALARATQERDRVNLSNTTIRSPVSGVVVDRVVDLGQTVAASFQTPVLIKIAQDLSEMRIDTSFAEADIGNLREGQKARFTVDAFPDRSFSGEVQQIRLNPTNQQNVVTYNVRVSVANKDQALLPGMTAYVSIGVAKRQEVLLLPNAALRFKPADFADKAEKAEKNGPKPASTATLSPGMGAGADGGGVPAKSGAGKPGKKRDGQSGTVYVLAGDEIKPVSVQIGITDNRNTEVLSGDLKAGDRVVTGENIGPAKKASSVGMRMF
ncbi:MAG: efflux RND transporter periplasmic adaptor subunit [Rhodocyclaceae bacterium]|nr:efflux RND transporter periplasmic adaptor subunit [Rhodocyclaceae bacterium]